MRSRQHAGLLHRRADPGHDPDLHRLRWYAVELVDEDSDWPAAICIYSDAEGDPVPFQPEWTIPNTFVSGTYK